jgi:hypothetical protein
MKIKESGFGSADPDPHQKCHGSATLLECVGHSFVYVAHLVFLRDVWIRTQRAAKASMRATGTVPT